ncbi:MAG: CBS domain-containing protein [Bellilinea sp.]
MDSTVRQILKEKGSEVWSVAPTTTVFDTLHLLSDKDIGAVVVLDNGKLVGIFSERDYVRQTVKDVTTIKYHSVSDYMTREVVTITPEETVKDCMLYMTAHRIRHLPVVEDEKLVGIITIGDVVKTVISDQLQLLEEMENFISGRYGR